MDLKSAKEKILVEEKQEIAKLISNTMKFKNFSSDKEKEIFLATYIVNSDLSLKNSQYNKEVLEYLESKYLVDYSQVMLFVNEIKSYNKKFFAEKYKNYKSCFYKSFPQDDVIDRTEIHDNFFASVILIGLFCFIFGIIYGIIYSIAIGDINGIVYPVLISFMPRLFLCPLINILYNGYNGRGYTPFIEHPPPKTKIEIIRRKAEKRIMALSYTGNILDDMVQGW